MRDLASMKVDRGRRCMNPWNLRISPQYTRAQNRILTAIALIVCNALPLDSSTPHTTTRVDPPRSASGGRSALDLPRAVRESAGFHTKQWDRGWEGIEASALEYREEVIILDPKEDVEGEKACIIWLHRQASSGEQLAQSLGILCECQHMVHSCCGFVPKK